MYSSQLSPIATAFTVSAEIRHSVANRWGSLFGWQNRLIGVCNFATRRPTLADVLPPKS